jgi:lysophospholipase
MDAQTSDPRRPSGDARVLARRGPRLASVALFALVALVGGGCRTLPAEGDPDDPAGRAFRAAVARHIATLRDAHPPLVLGPLDPTSGANESDPGREKVAPSQLEESLAAVLSYYGLDLPVPHAFGYVESPVSPLAVHVLRPIGARGTVFLLHGFYDHVGYHARTIGALVESGLAVVAFDLPGHGLSDGPRAEIEAIADYGRALRAVAAAVHGEVPEPWHFVGYSMGCTAIIDPLLRDGPDAFPFSRIVLVAPLVRSAWWGVSRIGVSVVGAFADDVPRIFPPSTPDPAVGRFRRYRDPLQHDRFSLAWFEALEAWQGEIRDAAPVDRPLLVLQGSDDDTVDADWNLEFIAEKFPRAELLVIPGAEHELLNERPTIRDAVIGAIVAALGETETADEGRSNASEVRPGAGAP